MVQIFVDACMPLGRISWCCDLKVVKMFLRLMFLTLMLSALKINEIGAFGKIVGILPKIINGTTAKAEEIRYQVSIHLKEREWYFGSGHICGGSLIKPSIVLTAAHCIYNTDLNVSRSADEFIVSMGSINRFDRINSWAFEVLEVSYKKTFNITTFVDDIALMFLNGFVPKNNHKQIKPIEINWKTIPEGTICQVSGWGVTEDGEMSDLLMTLNVPIVNQTICAEKYEGYVLEGMLCAGYMNGSADSCDGDSGGPLVCNGKLSGIISFGVGCAIKDFPGVYTDLKYHTNWIQNLTENINIFKGSASMTFKASPISAFLIICLLITVGREFVF